MFIPEILAQRSVPLGPQIGGPGLGPFTNITGSTTGGLQGLLFITRGVSAIIGVMTVAAGIWFLFNFISGGLQWISAGGDKNALQSAQQRIQNSFIGLVIVVAGWSILALAGKFLGFDILIRNPANLIRTLTP